MVPPVIRKFAAVNVGIAFRPSSPVRFNMRARTFKSELATAEVRRIHQAGQIERLVEVDKESRAVRCDPACNQIGCVAGAKRGQRIGIVVKVLQHDDVHTAGWQVGCRAIHEVD